MIPLDLDEIQKYLTNKNIHAELQSESNQLCIMLKLAEREFPLFIRIYDGKELIQLLAFLPCNTKPNTLADTARLLHLLNKELDVPGFGMDETSSTVFYRCLIPVKDQQIDKILLDAFLNVVQVACKTFAAVVAAVSYGAVTFEDVLKQRSQSMS